MNQDAQRHLGTNKRQSPQDYTERAYIGIRRMLFLNEIAPGQKLHYRDLAERLKMSPTPVIQAMKWLEFQGIVAHEKNRGYYMEPINIDEVREIYELREAVELSLLPRSIERLKAEGVERLKISLEAYCESCRERYTKQRLLKDMEFHMTLASLSGGKTAQRILRQLFDLLYLKYKVEVLFSRPMQHVDTEHRKVFDRVAARDLAGACEALSGHLRNVSNHVVEGIRRDMEEKETLLF